MIIFTPCVSLEALSSTIWRTALDGVLVSMPPELGDGTSMGGGRPAGATHLWDIYAAIILLVACVYVQRKRGQQQQY